MSYYRMHRGWMDNELFRRDPHNARSAWVWLIENAAWEQRTIRIERNQVTLERGELSCSEGYLAEQWNWSKSRVHRFLEDLTTHGMITRKSSPTRRRNSEPSREPSLNRDADRDANRPQAIISICNYNKYQSTAEIVELSLEPRPNRMRTESEPNIKKERKKEDSLSNESRQTAPSRRAVAESMVEVWKAELGSILSVPTQLTDKRVTSAVARHHADFHDDIEEWRAHCRTIRDTPFLTGDNDRQWRADFDWAIKAESVVRVREGKYMRGVRAAAPAAAYKRDEDYDGAHKAPWW